MDELVRYCWLIPLLPLAGSVIAAIFGPRVLKGRSHWPVVLGSAAANSQRPDAENLVVGRIWVDGGPMLKRWRPRAFGRAARIRKRLSHITIELTEPVGRGEEA